MIIEPLEKGTTIAASRAGDGLEELAVDLARDLIRYDTSNPSGREWSLQESLARRLTAADSPWSSWDRMTKNYWVIPTGGGYFFAPSIPAIRDVRVR